MQHRYNIECPACEANIYFGPDDIIGVPGYKGVICGECCNFVAIGDIISRDYQIHNNRGALLKVFDFAIGDKVLFINQEHIWNGEYAEVCDKKGCFCRVKIRDLLTWVPSHWLEKTDDNQ